MTIKSHKIRLNPTPEQEGYLRRACGTRRFVYNWGLAEWKHLYEAGEKPTAMKLKEQFNAIREDQFPWTYDVTKCAIEGAFFDLGAAFKHFFAGRETGRKVGYPQFKKKGKSRESFYVNNDKFTTGGCKCPSWGTASASNVKPMVLLSRNVLASNANWVV